MGLVVFIWEVNRVVREKILAIVPAYNEEANIVSTVEDLRLNAPGVDYVVVDDGSRDATAAICRERGYRFVSLCVNMGLAGGFRTGMKYAYRNGYDYAIQFDADGQHSAAYIPHMVEEAEKSGASIVIGSRFQTQKKPLSARMMGSTLITAMIRLTTGRTVKDPTSGMRLFDASMIRLFAQETDLGPEPDSLAFLMRRGTKVSEVQVEMRDRMAGESYLNLTKSVSYMLRMSISILVAQWFRRLK
nr:glycosyltransferase family 2 protein [Adlercreutzia sp. ZJ473]